MSYRNLLKKMSINTGNEANNMLSNTYESATLIGNWEEDQFHKRDKLAEFMKRKNSGSLYIQKTNAHLNAALEKVTLSMTTLMEERIYNHSIVMVQSVCNPDYVLSLNPDLPEHRDADSNHFKSPCPTSGCPVQFSCIRNAFMIVRCGNWMNENKPIAYGEPIYFVTLPPAGNMYLHSERVNFNKRAKWSAHQEVTFVANPNSQCRWQILPRSVAYRMELEGQPVVV